MLMNKYVEILRQSPEFISLMAEIKEARPIIPVYSHSPDNTEEWKANSNVQKGFDLALSFLGEFYD